ncbi:MAG: hypothetical protein MUC36_22830 [Planctomycetes bacterium]|jgi:hypothetical protein|nr:hypothetical protein [Planctomycetota bacterium]
MPLVAFASLLFCATAVAQTGQKSTWSAAANASTSSLHGSGPGGAAETITVTNNLRVGGSLAVTLTIEYWYLEGDIWKTGTYTTSIPYPGTRTWTGDIKSVVVTAGAQAAEGSWKI